MSTSRMVEFRTGLGQGVGYLVAPERLKGEF